MSTLRNKVANRIKGMTMSRPKGLPKLGSMRFRPGKKSEDKQPRNSKHSTTSPEPAVESVPKRVNAPNLPAGLLKTVSAGDYVLWVGDLASTLSTKSFHALLSEMLSLVEAEKMNDVTELLSKQDTESLNQASEMLKSALGEEKYTSVLQTASKPDVTDVDGAALEQLGWEIIDNLAPRCIVTTSRADLSNLTKYNIVSSDDITDDMKLDSDKPTVFQLLGNSASPDSLKFNPAEVVSLLSDVASSPTAKFLGDLMKTNTVLFIGADFNETSFVPKMLLSGKAGHAEEQVTGAEALDDSTKTRLYALLTENYVSEANTCNVEPILYEPDQFHSQRVEFLSFLASARNFDTLEPFTKMYNVEAEGESTATKYWADQLAEEQAAKGMYIYNPTAFSSITSKAFLDQAMLPILLKSYGKDASQDILEVLQKRQDSLSSRVSNAEEDVSVQIMLSKKMFESTNEAGMQHMLDLIEGSNGKIKIKFLKEETDVSYTLNFQENRVAWWKDQVIREFEDDAKIFTKAGLKRMECNTTEAREMISDFTVHWFNAVSADEVVKCLKEKLQPKK